MSAKKENMPKKNRQKLSSHLLQEWHPTRNGSTDPSILTAKSGKSPWWQCSQCSHEWQAPIYHRSNGTGCPKCKPKSAWVKHLNSILDKRGSLAEHHPQLISEWHPTKNGSVTPDQISPSSGKKFWWKCPKGEDHEWEAIVSNRTKGRGCPVCSGRKASISNCLETTHPEVAKEWHPIKNEKLLPSEITFASHKKIWWKCQTGHEWRVSVSNRTSRGKSECPICLKADIGQRRVRSLIKRDGSLSQVFPEIAKQWHPTKNEDNLPSKFTASSRHRAWWLCNKGHEWCVSISARKNHGCPKCSYQTSQLEIRIFCELKGIFPDATWRERIASKECDIFLPRHKIAIEIDGFPWHKDREGQDKLKKELLSTHGVHLFRVRDQRLPKISESDVFYKDKEAHLQIIVRILHHIKDRIVLSDLEKSKIAEYLHINKLTDEETFKKMLNDVWSVPEQESIVYLHPEAALDWDYEKNTHLSPKNFSSSSEVSVYWKCQKNGEHKWKTKIKDRIKSKGCPFCSGRRVGSDNSLAVLHPELVAQWDYEKNSLLPTQVSGGSNRKVWWKCHCDSSWQATIWSRVNSGNPECLRCYNQHGRGQSQIRKAVQKNGSFADKYPTLSHEWHPTKNGALTPHSLSCGSSTDVWWKCPKGTDHEWQNSIVARIQHPICPFCCGKKVSLANSLQHCFPLLAKEWHPTKNTLNSTEITKCSGRKAWWQCAKGHDWEATVTARRKGNGCPFCAGKKAAFDDNFESHFPRLATEWHKLKNNPSLPAEFRPNSNSKVWWSCLKHPEHIWKASIASRARGTGCPFCAGKQTSTFYNLKVVNPSLAQEWHSDKNAPLLPHDVTPNSGRKVWWQCQKKHEWQATINNRTKGRGCPYCRTQKSNPLHEQP
jgi:hypothetical protein